MSTEESISRWLEELRAGDEAAAEHLWKRYFDRLVQLAGRKLAGQPRREFDEEDVALSAFHSLWRGVRSGRFPELESRDNLWSLLVVITARKVYHRIRDRKTQKRGGGRVRGESVFQRTDREDDAVGIQQVIGAEPTPAFAAQVAEESERLLEFLEDDSLRTVTRLKMEGHSNDEIASRLGCGKRTVERRLRLIRDLWLSYADAGPAV